MEAPLQPLSGGPRTFWKAREGCLGRLKPVLPLTSLVSRKPREPGRPREGRKPRELGRSLEPGRSRLLAFSGLSGLPWAFWASWGVLAFPMLSKSLLAHKDENNKNKN